jgi:hydroxymethylpyrimidine/phosphomethylpyrimidine kinase
VILAQVIAIVDDIGVDAIKIGMLGSVDTIEAVRYALEQVPRDVPIVLDPLMVAESGAILVDHAARAALVERLLPRATVVTPNVPEAREMVRPHGLQRAAGEAGAGIEAGAGNQEGAGTEAGAGNEDEEAELLARAVRRLGPEIVVLTGGHRLVATDVFYDGRDFVEIPGERHPDGAAHGSGCTHASILAARLALGDDPLSAARFAKEMTSRAVADGLREIGRGAGPVNVLGLRPAGALS